MNRQLYIFWTFLKLGTTAFGGYMSLVAMVQKQLVEIDKQLKEEDLLDGISLTSMLPGPVAVNVIAYVGYRMGGLWGAFWAFLGIILPSLLLVIGLSWGYFTYGHIPAVKNIFLGITPAITALIVTVAIGMARKGIRSTHQIAIAVCSALLLTFIGGFTLTFCLIVGSGIIGYVLFRHSVEADPCVAADRMGWKQLVISGCVLFVLLSLLLWGGQNLQAPIEYQLLSTFSGISLTLFGGGYVVIPALHELFVDQLHWLSSSEFADGIAIGQITPGPIFITATFIGYKVAGIGGALLATLGIFTPPAVLTVLMSRFVALVNHSVILKAALKGIRSAVIGMIFASAVTIGQTMAPSWVAVALFAVVFLISYIYKVSPIYLIVGSGAAGLLLF